jgi:hypothetical protein
MIRNDIQPDDYVYDWRCQGYIKVIEIIDDVNIYRNGKAIVCDVSVFDPLMGARTFNFEGKLLNHGYNNIYDYLQEAGPGYCIFNDLDEYYEFVKNTTNTPLILNNA